MPTNTQPREDVIVRSYRVEGFPQTLDYRPGNVWKNTEDLIQVYWQNHPRFSFLKMTAPNCRLLDVGANAGGLSYWKEYGAPRRTDIRMFGVDLALAARADRYEQFYVLNLDTDSIPTERSSMDSILMSHVIEHLHQPARVLEELHRVLVPGGRLYLEWPAPWTAELPSRAVFQDSGIPVGTIRFDDDHTHIEPFQLNKLSSMVQTAGLIPTTSGIVSMPFLEDQLFSTGIATESQELVTYGLWLKARWAQFLIAEKPQ